MWGRLLGSLLGAGIGLLFDSPWAAGGLATIGLAAGWFMFDREPEQPKSFDAPPRPVPIPERDTDTRRPVVSAVPPPKDYPLARALCPVFIEVARVDSAVSQPEIRVVREFFEHELGAAPAALEAVRTALKDAIAAAPIDLHAVTTRIRGLLAPAQRLQFVNALYELALVDGELKRSESDAIKQVVAALNLSDEQLAEITKSHLGSGVAHYAVLGVDSSASDDEVRSAFKRLAAENHPDRVAHLGPFEARLSADRFRKVKDAWEAVRKLRGL